MALKLENMIGYIIAAFIVIGISMAFFLYPLTQNQPLPIIKPAPEFTLINQDNQTVVILEVKSLCWGLFIQTVRMSFVLLKLLILKRFRMN
ncbi:MAG: hypothetical protein ACTSSO_06420 [Candidatus Hodarchaeales archaeon]